MQIVQSLFAALSLTAAAVIIYLFIVVLVASSGCSRHVIPASQVGDGSLTFYGKGNWTTVVEHQRVIRHFSNTNHTWTTAETPRDNNPDTVTATAATTWTETLKESLVHF